MLEFDGTSLPEVLSKTVEGLILDEDYSFFVTGLNPYEGEASISSTYRAAGRPSAVQAISEIDGSRTGQRIGLQWSAPADNGGSQILAYTLLRVQDNVLDVVVYHGDDT